MKKYILPLLVFGLLFGSFFNSNSVLAQNNTGLACTDIKNDLRYTSRGAEVVLLQNYLYAKKLLPLPKGATGYFGTETVKAVKELQKLQQKAGIPKVTPTGYVGSATRSAIKAETCPNTPPPSDGTCTYTAPTFIRVKSPNGGEIITAGDQLKIAWESCHVAKNELLRIVASSKKANFSKILSGDGVPNGAPTSGAYTTNTSTWPSADDYKITVGRPDDIKSLEDESDKPFTVKLPPVSSSIEVFTDPVVLGEEYIGFDGTPAQTSSTFMGRVNANELAKSWNVQSAGLHFWFWYGDNPQNLQYLASNIPIKNCSKEVFNPCTPDLGVNTFSQQVAAFPFDTRYYVKACVGNSSDSQEVFFGRVKNYKCGETVSFIIKRSDPRSITVLSPNGGESYKKSHTLVVSWSTKNIPTNSNIFASLVDSTGRQLRTAHATGSHTSLTIPLSDVNFPPGSYKIYLEVNDGVHGNLIARDYSEGSFNILDDSTGYPPGCTSSQGYSTTTGLKCDGSGTPSCGSTARQKITITSPNGGETFVAGQPITVTWNSCNITSANPYLQFLLKMDGSDSVWDMRGGESYDIYNSSGTATFTLPVQGSGWPNQWYQMQYGKNFKISVADNALITKDETDNLFTISAPASGPYPPGCTSSSGYSTTTGLSCGGSGGCTATSAPSITVLSPNGGETYIDGQELNIKWTSCNVPTDAYVRAFAVYKFGASVVVTGAGNGWTKNDGTEHIVLPRLYSWGGAKASSGAFYELAMEVQSMPGVLGRSARPFTITSEVPYKISYFEGVKSSYQSGASINVFLKGTEIEDGTYTTAQEGFHVQAYIYKDIGQINEDGMTYLPPNPTYSYNAVFDTASNSWNVNMLAPYDAGNYILTTSLYCSKQGSYCEKYQTTGHSETKRTKFSVSSTTLPTDLSSALNYALAQSNTYYNTNGGYSANSIYTYPIMGCSTAGTVFADPAMQNALRLATDYLGRTPTCVLGGYIGGKAEYWSASSTLPTGKKVCADSYGHYWAGEDADRNGTCDPVREYYLTVQILGTGKGKVTSTDGVVNCTENQCYYIYPAGKKVTLWAEDGADSKFGGFSEECKTDTRTTSVTLHTNKWCTATFHLTPVVNPPISYPEDLPVKAGDKLVMFWEGKVNNFLDPNGKWQTEPDGYARSSGADVDKLQYCRMHFPNTKSVIPFSMETTNTWYREGNIPPAYESRNMAYKCVQTERVGFWWGKYNVSVNTNTGNWESDPTRSYGASMDYLAYCKVAYPNTVAIEKSTIESIDVWRDAYGGGPYTSTVQTYKCVQPTDSVSAPLSGGLGLLPATSKGVVLGAESSSKVCLDIEYTLYPKTYDTSEKFVSLLQDFLQIKGLLNKTTGYYGIDTQNAVKKYQRLNNLPATGNVGTITSTTIKRETCSL